MRFIHIRTHKVVYPQGNGWPVKERWLYLGNGRLWRVGHSGVPKMDNPPPPPDRWKVYREKYGNQPLKPVPSPTRASNIIGWGD